MSSFKKLNKADVTTVSYAANKQWNLSYTTTPNDSYVTYYVGRNESFNINGSTTTDSQYQSLVYSQINHLFYQSYTSSLDTGSIMFNTETYISASQQRPTASYFNYNINPLLIKQFPTGSNEYIGIININQDIYGSKILPNTFNISSSHIFIKDDGNGNLYDVKQAQDQYVDLNFITLNYSYTGSLVGTGIYFVGNIFYAHGIAVITNLDYQTYLSPDCRTVTFTNRGSISTTWYYTDCGNNSVTRSLSPTQQISDCVNINKSITRISGTGTYTTSAFGSCATNLPTKVISFQNEHIIYENEVRCIVKESDYNLTYNPTILKYKGQYIVPISGSNSIMTGSNNSFILTGSFDSTVKDFATGSSFQPYMTTIGLYNDDNDLLMVAKLAQPIALSSDTDMTFIVKYDT